MERHRDDDDPDRPDEMDRVEELEDAGYGEQDEAAQKDEWAEDAREGGAAS